MDELKKDCIYCGESIGISLRRCPYCGSLLRKEVPKEHKGENLYKAESFNDSWW